MYSLTYNAYTYYLGESKYPKFSKLKSLPHLIRSRHLIHPGVLFGAEGSFFKIQFGGYFLAFLNIDFTFRNKLE
jgi:hypothetical protein